MDPLEMIEQHLNKLGAMANELDTIEAAILEEVKVMVMLMNLSNN
jgi:hypothetical protein